MQLAQLELAEMMGRGSGRSLVLLGAVATLLVISSSAVSGVPDEYVHNLLRSEGRLEHQGHRGADGGVSYAHRKAAHVTDELKRWESVEVVDEKKPAEGILEKARSFLSGLATSVGNGIPSPSSVVREKKHWGAVPQTAEKSFGRRTHIRGRQSRWAGIRDLIRSHPEKLAAAAGASAADISETEPLSVNEDAIPVSPVSEMRAKIIGTVMAVVEEYNAGTDPNLESTCADVLEIQVKTLVKSVKSALRERICNDDVASVGDQTFCNVLNNHPTMAAFQSLWMAHVNPVKVSWHQISKTAACSSVNPFSGFLDSLQEMEGMARQFNMLLPEGIDTEDNHLKHDRESRMFHQPRREHGDHKRNWWQRMLHMKPHHSEEMHEHGDHVRHSGQQMLNKDMKPHHFGERREHGEHEKHGWQRLFGMFRKHKQMKHLGSEHANENSAMEVCFYKSVKYLSRGVRQHLASACETTTSPNEIAACKFAKEHHFLVKAWLAARMPVWFKATKSCMPTLEDRRAPDLGVGRFAKVERQNPVDGEDAFNEAGRTKERQLNTFGRGCARNHVNRGFSKALHLRGHVIGINQEDSGLQGLVRTHLIVLGGHPIHLHDFQDALENLQALDHSSSGDMLTDLQDRVAEFVRDSELVRDAVSGEHRALPGLKTEMMVLRPFHHHANFRISANPRVRSTTEGPHFRISAMPRVVREANTEMPVIGPNDVVDDVASDMDAGVEVELQDKTPRETAEKRADM